MTRPRKTPELEKKSDIQKDKERRLRGMKKKAFDF